MKRSFKNPAFSIAIILALVLTLSLPALALGATRPVAGNAGAGPLSTWYLAEGTTDWGFETFISMENPNNDDVTVRVTYQTPQGPITRADITLYPTSQTYLQPSEDIGARDFSTKVVCLEGETIAVERTMLWAASGQMPEGHSSIGVTSPAKIWYLPEGSSDWGFECWLLIQNPNATTATCQVTYMIEGQGPVTISKSVPANSRRTFFMADDIGSKDASIKVVSNLSVIPERAMYRNNRREGHDSIGTTAPSKDYYLAEGTTDWGFTTYVLVQNPNDTPTTVTVTYMTPTGPITDPPFTMPARSRKTICVNQSHPGRDLSTKVHGSQPIIAERSMYWNSGWGEACHDSIGLAAPHSVFYLPDAETALPDPQTGADAEAWTLVQNPNATFVTIRVTYLRPYGSGNIAFVDTIPANSRKSYNMGDKLPEGVAAVVVECLTAGKKILAELAMYMGQRSLGTDTIGGFSD